MKLSILVASNAVGLELMKYKDFVGLIDYELLIGIPKDETIKIDISTYTKIIYQNESNIGTRKQQLLNIASHKWILLLDTDEVVSSELLKEIQRVISYADVQVNGYAISYQNYVFGKPMYYGGEKYSKVRLFQKKYGSVTEVPIHEEVVVKGKIGKLKNVIHHYSYRTPWQVIKKFTRYAWLIAGEKRKAYEGISFAKLFLYGPHMVWARCIKDEGWRDGWRGVVLAILFGYMESMIYWLLLWRNLTHV
jgi:hypothetical protein